MTTDHAATEPTRTAKPTTLTAILLFLLLSIVALSLAFAPQAAATTCDVQDGDALQSAIDRSASA